MIVPFYTLVTSGLKGLGLVALALGMLVLLFWLFQPDYRHIAPIAASGGETALIVEGAKEYSSLVGMLTTLTTGLFVLVALVVRTPLRPSTRASGAQIILLMMFGICASGGFYAALHAKFAIAEGMLAKSLDLPLIENQIGMMAWFVACSGGAAIALIADALLTFQERAAGSTKND